MLLPTFEATPGPLGVDCSLVLEADVVVVVAAVCFCVFVGCGSAYVLLSTQLCSIFCQIKEPTMKLCTTESQC